MNLLAFDTSTEAMSIAVARGGAVLEFQGPGGARSSTELIPQVLALMAQAELALPELDAVVFGSGPGSFTGLRTACSVAQGLALGAGLPVLPVETLMAVAEDARRLTGADDVLAVLDARMDEVYAARYRHDGALWQREGEIALCAPEALPWGPGRPRAGHPVAPSRFRSRARCCGWRRPSWPRARAGPPSRPCRSTCVTRWRKPRPNARPPGPLRPQPRRRRPE